MQDTFSWCNARNGERLTANQLICCQEEQRRLKAIITPGEERIEAELKVLQQVVPRRLSIYFRYQRKKVIKFTPTTIVYPDFFFDRATQVIELEDNHPGRDWTEYEQLLYSIKRMRVNRLKECEIVAMSSLELRGLLKSLLLRSAPKVWRV